MEIRLSKIWKRFARKLYFRLHLLNNYWVDVGESLLLLRFIDITDLIPFQIFLMLLLLKKSLKYYYLESLKIVESKFSLDLYFKWRSFLQLLSLHLIYLEKVLFFIMDICKPWVIQGFWWNFNFCLLSHFNDAHFSKSKYIFWKKLILSLKKDKFTAFTLLTSMISS